MKRYLPYVIGTVLGMLLAVVFSVRRASALGPPCFTDTNGHLFETFICWMFDNGLTTGYGDGTFGPDDNITRGQMAVFLQRMRSLGDTHITFGPNAWVVNSNYPTGYINRYTVLTHFRSTAAGTILYFATPFLPSSLYNSLMYIKGVQICYDATPGFGAVIDTVSVEHWKTYDDGTTFLLASYTDGTNRSDAECRGYYLPTPSSFFGDNHLVISIYAIFGGSADLMKVSSTTVILSPSASPAFLGPDDVLLQPTEGEFSPVNEADTGR